MLKAVKIVPESQVYIVEKLGKYYQSLSSGLSFINPFFDKVSRIVSLKEQVVDFDPQAVITKDNATMQIDTVVYFQITDPKLYTYGVERPLSAIENLTATTLRNIIGDMTVDETLTSRDIINTKMRQELDDATDPWGIKVNRVELKSILPPNDIRIAMEKEMKAEREKRAKILEAQATRESAILVAEGEKQSRILKAEGERQEAFLQAEARERAAEAEAKATQMVSDAIANGDTKAINYFIAQKYTEALKEIGGSDNSKVVLMPLEAGNLIGSIAGISELLKSDKKTN